MGNFNKVILLGNVTRDVDLKYLASGTAVADIGLAINEYRKDKDGAKVEDTVFVDITLWARNAEIASEYVKKGDPLLIEGRLRLDSWETEDGTRRSKLKVVAERLQLITTRKNSVVGNKTADAASPVAEDDVPF